MVAGPIGVDQTECAQAQDCPGDEIPAIQGRLDLALLLRNDPAPAGRIALDTDQTAIGVIGRVRHGRNADLRHAGRASLVRWRGIRARDAGEDRD
ncbi:hypothetical protein BB934_10865 [Microvirga ossetica]|uniref:Uncharacterized protein n=2 Tax=Microvirga ossetica TaxID=1882682 RepID=A0A1B2EFB8_9HYPH|nr:hypothetical protein BB934_10865 [Microvirga ossetica]